MFMCLLTNFNMIFSKYLTRCLKYVSCLNACQCYEIQNKTKIK